MPTKFRHGSTFAQVAGRRYLVLALVRPISPSCSCGAQRLIPALLLSACGRDRDLLAEQWRAMRKQLVAYRAQRAGAPGNPETIPAAT